MTNPKITLSAGTSPVEGSTGTYLISLDTAAPAGGLTVDYNTTGSTASFNKDYHFTAGENLSVVTDGSFTIVEGAKTASLNIDAIADAVFDPNESVVVNLTAGTGYYFVGTDPQFVQSATVAVGDAPYSIISTDFNGDGKADLATVNGDDGTISILLGNGKGDFAAHTDFKAGSSPWSVISTDFNGDGNADLAAANCNYDGTVSVLLGNGTGGFTSNITVVVNGYPISITSADFNGDDNIDLATANAGDRPGSVSVRLGNGSGGFTDDTTVAIGGVPSSVVSTDFNGDGNADLAVSNYDGAVSVRLGNGSGGFTDDTTVAMGGGSSSLVSTDFNGDSNADLAVSNWDANTVSVRLGNGSGGFSGTTELAVGSNPYSITSADFNGDGNADLATANSEDSTVSVRLGNGGGGFTGNTTIALAKGSWPRSITAADFNGDGYADLATANIDRDTIAVLLYTGNTASAMLTLTDDGLYVPQYLHGDQGSPKNDLLTGNNGADMLWGRDMADTLSGAIGNDELYGGKGSDSLLGGLGNDSLSGGWDNDTLNGGVGNDTITGGIGHDVLTGGSGSDIFCFINKPKAANTDRITDFSVTDDTIQLASSQFTQLTATGVLNADNFMNGATANDANDYVIYNPTTGALLYDADGNGAGVGLRIALLGVDLALTNADFVII